MFQIRSQHGCHVPRIRRLAPAFFALTVICSAANAQVEYSAWGSLFVNAIRGETFDRVIPFDTRTSAMDQAESVGPAGNVASGGYVANLATASLGSWSQTANAFSFDDMLYLGGIARTEVSLQDELRFAVPDGEYPAGLFATLRVRIGGVVSASGDESLNPSAFQVYSLDFGTVPPVSERFDAVVDAPPLVVFRSFALTTQILAPGTILPDPITVNQILVATLQNGASTPGLMTAQTASADFSNTLEFVAFEVPEEVTWTSASGVFMSEVPGVGGEVTGLAPFVFVACINRTTGQSVTALVVRDTKWDCEEEGLLVERGQTVDMFIRGVVE